MQPLTRFWIKILVATTELAFIVVAALAIGQFVPYWVGAIAVAILFLERAFYIMGGLSGYASYRAHIKEAHRGESRN